MRADRPPLAGGRADGARHPRGRTATRARAPTQVRGRPAEAVELLRAAEQKLVDADGQVAEAIRVELLSSGQMSAGARARGPRRRGPARTPAPARRPSSSASRSWRSRERTATCTATADEVAQLAARALEGEGLPAELRHGGHALGLAATVLLFAEHLERAEAIATDALEAARSRGSAFESFHWLAMRAVVRCRAGRLLGAEEDATAALGWRRPCAARSRSSASHWQPASRWRSTAAATTRSCAPPSTASWCRPTPRPLAPARRSGRTPSCSPSAARRARGWRTSARSAGRADLGLGKPGDAAVALDGRSSPSAAGGAGGGPRAGARGGGAGSRLRCAPGTGGGPARRRARHGGARGVELLGEAVSTLRESTAELERARALVDLGAALRRGRQRRPPATRSVRGSTWRRAVALRDSPNAPKRSCAPRARGQDGPR